MPLIPFLKKSIRNSRKSSLRKFGLTICLFTFTVMSGAVFAQFEGRWYTTEVLIFEQSSKSISLQNLPFTGNSWSQHAYLNYPDHYQYLKKLSDLEDVDHNSMTLESNNAPGETDISNPPLENFLLLPASEQSLISEAKSLEISSLYRILFHEVWQQQMFSEAKSPSIIISGGNSFGSYSELSGFIKIHIGRYLHFSSDLWLLSPNHLGDSPSNALDNSMNSERSKELKPKQYTIPLPPPNPYIIHSETKYSNPTVLLNESDVTILSRMQETKRMRSLEIHYIDSPSLGILITFKPLEARNGTAE